MNTARFCKTALGGFGAALLLTAGMATTALASEAVTTMATTAPLNLRDAPSMDGTIIGSLPTGTAVNVHSVESDWHQVKYNDVTAYASSEYLR